LQVESLTAFSKPHPLVNLDQLRISCHRQSATFLLYYRVLNTDLIYIFILSFYIYTARKIMKMKKVINNFMVQQPAAKNWGYLATLWMATTWWKKKPIQPLRWKFKLFTANFNNFVEKYKVRWKIYIYAITDEFIWEKRILGYENAATAIGYDHMNSIFCVKIKTFSPPFS